MTYPDHPLTYKTRLGTIKTIPAGKWCLNRWTPVGDDPDYYELKPHNGRKYIPYHLIVPYQLPSAKAAPISERTKIGYIFP